MSIAIEATAPATTGRLMTVEEATQLIRTGHFLSIAGDEQVLRRLPQGNWIAGTIPYFMGQGGGETTRTRVFVQRVSQLGARPEIRFYDLDQIRNIAKDAPENGYSIVIVPAFTDLHTKFAREAPNFEDMFMKPIVGWVAGAHLDDLPTRKPTVVNGRTLEFDTRRAVVMHVSLPSTLFARVDMINLFEPGTGDVIRFPENGFSATACTVNGRKTNLAQYLQRSGVDLKLPFVGDHSGALLNVSVRNVDAEKGVVDFYAPVFEDIEYRIAAPLRDYVEQFGEHARALEGEIAWCCNCVLNYLYLGLEGRKVGRMTGPMTFGEIAYQLTNQTLVHLIIDSSR